MTARTKKVARYQQVFAIQRMLERVRQTEPTEYGSRHKGGIIWHTQGSGKSLTMVMFVRALIEQPGIINSRVLIVTDRIDLDKQIKTKIRTGASPRHVPAKIIQVEDIPRTKSGKIVELAVREVVHGRPVKNKEALANPEALSLFADLPQLRS